jgi:uncharacterized membrane protein
MGVYTFPPFPILLAILLAGHGHRKGSLSANGALAAFCVGSSMMAVPLRTFGISLIGFYLLGSRATKVGKQRKRNLEENYDAASERGATQVACNALGAWFAALLWSGGFVDAERDVFSAAAGILAEFAPWPRRMREYSPNAWCALDAGVGNGWSRALVFIALG